MLKKLPCILNYTFSYKKKIMKIIIVLKNYYYSPHITKLTDLFLVENIVLTVLSFLNIKFFMNGSIISNNKQDYYLNCCKLNI